MRKRYDLIFGLGVACSCTQTLRKAGLQFLSFPFDWIGPNSACEAYTQDLVRRTDILCSGLLSRLDPADFKFRGGPLSNGMADYFNERLELQFIHDFPWGVPFNEAFPKIKAKYAHRVARLIEIISGAKKVLVFKMERPDTHDRPPVEQFRRARNRLQERFPGVRFEFLSLRQQDDIPFATRKVECIEGFLTTVTFDYRSRDPEAESYQPDMDLTAKAVRALVTVRDYRTREEKQKHRDARLARKLENSGCSSLLQFRLKRLRASILRRLPSWRGGIMAWHYRQRFAHIIPLGVNCETAFRFYCRWGFIDSSLFAWAQSFNLETLTRALRDFDSILAGEATFDRGSFLWKCENTGLHFHGRLKLRIGSAMPSPEAIAKDLDDLRGRISHLKRKFLDYLADGGSTLFVHRLAEPDAGSDRLGERLSALEDVLAGLGARNWKLLVVCRRADRRAMPEGDHRIFRPVDVFAPPDRVTDEKAGDPRGWKTIFSEFAPERILPKKHAFKFE